MTQRTLRIVDVTANKLSFADPANFLNTFSAALQVQQKNAGTAVVHNTRTECVSSRLVPVLNDKNEEVGKERVSVRTIISGSTKNKALVLKAIKDHNLNVGTVFADTGDGFKPLPTVTLVIDSE